jgi:glycosyltransferase involved in cell wall biosynthesis
MPLVSICIPTYNGALYVREALASVKIQTYKNLEIIISDDASNDDTLKIIDDFKRYTDYPVNVYHHIPAGIGANWNNCFKYAKGEYIKFLFQDDILYPTCIEEMVRILEADKKIGLVACKREFIVHDPDNVIVQKWIGKYRDLQDSLNLTKAPTNIINKDFLKSELFLQDPLNKIGEPTCVLFRTTLIEEVGMFNKNLKQVLDCEFYYRILKHHEIAIINIPLVKFRIHSKQATNINRINHGNDKEIYNKILYHDFFWLLNYKYQRKLFFCYNPLGKILKKHINFKLFNHTI